MKVVRNETGAFVCARPEPLSALEALGRFAVTEEQVEQLESTRMIWRDCIPLSHLIVWSGIANSGKTALATFAAGELAPRGYQVLYFQEDAAAGDLPTMYEHAKRHGYLLLNSTLSNASPDDQLEVLRALVRDGADLSGYVLILDTMKKYLSVMSKDGARVFFGLMRSLTQRGATVILLGHTNKNVGPDGKPVFEGVGDVRNDVDELFYLESTDKDAMGVKTMTLTPDKNRSPAKAATFSLDTNTMTVRALDRVVDVHELGRQRVQRDQDRQVISAIDEALRDSGMNRTDLIEAASVISGHGAKSVRKVLDRYCSEDKDDIRALWLLTPMRLNNVKYVSRNPVRSCQTEKPAERARRAEPAEPEVPA